MHAEVNGRSVATVDAIVQSGACDPSNRLKRHENLPHSTRRLTQGEAPSQIPLLLRTNGHCCQPAAWHLVEPARGYSRARNPRPTSRVSYKERWTHTASQRHMPNSTRMKPSHVWLRRSPTFRGVRSSCGRYGRLPPPPPCCAASAGRCAPRRTRCWQVPQ